MNVPIEEPDLSRAAQGTQDQALLRSHVGGLVLPPQETPGLLPSLLHPLAVDQPPQILGNTTKSQYRFCSLVLSFKKTKLHIITCHHFNDKNNTHKRFMYDKKQ